MTLVAVASPGSDGQWQVRLTAPAQRHAWAGDRLLLLGFPASAEREPWGTIEQSRRVELARGALEGTTRLRGNWTLVGDDGGELVVRTDPYGTRPLFFRSGPDGVEVSEEIWPLLEGHPELDPVGVADFLVLGHHMGRRTCFAGVSVVEPDTVWRFGPDGASKRVLAPEVPEPGDESFEAAVEAVGDHLQRVFDPYRDVEGLLIGLSGGLDSRALLAVAVDEGLDVHAWTFTLVRGSEEEALARRVAQSLGVGHTVSYTSAEDLVAAVPEFVRASSGQKSIEHVHGYPMRGEPPERFAVHVDGIVGGLICGGSILLPEGIPDDTVEHECVLRYLSGRDPASVQRRLPGADGWADRLYRLVGAWYETAGRSPRLADYVDLRNTPSRLSVWWSIAARDRFEYLAPFLDEDLVRCCYGIPEEYQRHAAAYRAAIARRWPSLGKIPWEKTGKPVARYPGRVSRRLRSIRRWYGIGRPIGYFDRRNYAAAFGDLMTDAVESLTPVLSDLGIDLGGLLEDFGESAQLLLLRVASLHLTLEEAGRGGARRRAVSLDPAR